MSDLQEFKCPNCAGAIEFDSSVQKMKCPYCDSEFEMEALKIQAENQKSEEPDNMVWDISAGSEWNEGETEGMRVYSCHSCGGEIVAEETTGASSCPYCDNPIVMTGNFSGALKPDLVIPFKLDKKAAKEGLKKHLQGKRLLPNVFKDENHIDEVKGIYVPFWLFDADVNADVRFLGTKVKHWSDSNYEYTETDYYNIYRSGSVGFSDVPVDGSSKIDNDLMESIEPFNLADAVDFQTAYLAGYLADKYDVTAEESIEFANERMKKSTTDVMSSTVKGYVTLTPESSSVRLYNGTAKYALYPVWLLNTTWKDNKYTFAMNGQTGKFVGNLPLDKGKYWRWFGGLSAGFVAAFIGISYAVYTFLL